MPFDPFPWLRVDVQRNEPALNQVEKDGSSIRAPWLDWKFAINLERAKNIGQKSHSLVGALNTVGQKGYEQPMFLKELHCLGFMNGLDI